MLETYWRKPLRKLLLKILNWTEKEPKDSKVVRGGSQRIWQREIHIPSTLVAIFSLMIFLMVLVLEIGLSWIKIGGLLILLLMTFIFLTFYLRHNQPELVNDSEAIMLLGLLLVSSVLLMQVFKEWPLAFPLTSFVILVGLLLSEQLAIIAAVILSLIFGIFNNFSLEYSFVHLAGSFASITSLSKIRNRVDLTRLSIKISAVYSFAILTIHFFGIWHLRNIKIDLFLGIISGILSVLIVLGTLPYLETFFSRTTNIKLLELADFTQPLLKRLILEAPGTYHHSLIMASLSEQAAESIGANSLLARVGAYYHDIGKLSNPEYFIENQQTMGNPHDPLAPTMSSLVVISHIKEGVALAKQNKLDKVIIDCIEQHHGTSLIHYFYHRALEQNAEIKEDSFRYPGPKPKSKVTAILMLADAVEAASRTIEEPSPGRIKDVVEKIINNKFIDGQFSECPITLHDLSKIAESLVVSLSGLYHARIEYQETIAAKNEG